MDTNQHSKLLLEKQEAIEKARMCEKFLSRYRYVMGPVNDVSELRAAGLQDLLSIRFAILKGIRDDEARKASTLHQQLTSAHKG